MSQPPPGPPGAAAPGPAAPGPGPRDPGPAPRSPDPAVPAGLNGVKVAGQALAAVTTAGVGGVLGGAGGIVVGAAVASVVTTVADAFYQRSIERTRDTVRRRIQGRRGASGPHGAPPPADESPTLAMHPVDPHDGRPGSDARTAGPRRGWGWKRYVAVAATALLVFLIAMVVVTGVERIKGSPLSGGDSGTSVGEVFGTRAPESSTETTAPTTGSDTATTTEAPTSTGRAPETEDDAPTTTRRSRGGLLPSTLNVPVPGH